MYRKNLFADTNDIAFDELTIQTLERQAKDQLDGGKYRIPSENVLKSAKNVPAHKIILMVGNYTKKL